MQNQANENNPRRRRHKNTPWILAIVILAVIFAAHMMGVFGRESLPEPSSYTVGGEEMLPREPDEQAIWERDTMDVYHAAEIERQAQKTAYWMYFNGPIRESDYAGEDGLILDRAKEIMAELLVENPLDDPDNLLLIRENERRLINELMPPDESEAIWIDGGKLSFDQIWVAVLAFDHFRAEGYSAAQAAGFVAQAFRESSLDPLKVGDDGDSFGLFMLNGPRLYELKAMYPKSWQTATAQLRYITSEAAADDWTGGRSFETFRETTSVEEAAEELCRYFIRPARPTAESAKRSELGAELLNIFGHEAPAEY